MVQGGVNMTPSPYDPVAIRERLASRMDSHKKVLEAELESLRSDYNKLCSAVTETQRILESTEYSSRMNQLADARNALRWEGDTQDSMHERRIKELEDEVRKLRHIATHVPAREYIKAKEAAGHGTEIHAH